MGSDGTQWDGPVKSWEINGFSVARGFSADLPRLSGRVRNKSEDGALLSTRISGAFFFCSLRTAEESVPDRCPAAALALDWEMMGKGGRWPVSRVLSPAPYPLGRRVGGWPFLWDDGRPSPRATNPGGRRKRLSAHGFPWAGPPLFGLAPGGVCRAATVTGRAVRSYRTLSPLPGRSRAVCFLWHCPWGCPRRALPGTVFPWSPDFPPRRAQARQSGHPAICCPLYRNATAGPQGGPCRPMTNP